MKWPRVLPCNPVPSRPSNSACLRGKKGLQCGFNPTQPLLSFSGFVTSYLPPHLTHLHDASSSPCSRCNFISCRAPLQYLCCRSLSSTACTHSSLLPSFLCFPSPFLSLSPSLLLFGKKERKKEKNRAKLKQSLSSSCDLSLGKKQKSFYCCNEMSCCVIFAVSIFQESSFACVLGSWSAGAL